MLMQQTRRAKWSCPRCGRSFRNPNQWHSCVVVSVDSHFKDKPDWLRESFDAIVCHLQQLAPVSVDAVKTSINLAGTAHFAGVQVARAHMTLEFMLERSVSDPRISRQIDAGTRTSNVVKVSRPEDVDGQLLAWLTEAFASKA